MRNFTIGLLAVLAYCTSAPGQTKQNTNPDIGWQALGKQGPVCAGGSEEVAAGPAALKNGGQAVDAPVTTILALSVTDSKSVSLVGEMPVALHNAHSTVVQWLC